VTSSRLSRIDGVRHALLELHKTLIDAQRIEYERANGRVGTTSEFLGLVLEHRDFEWIRAFSALLAQLDEWLEAPDTSSDREAGDILEAFRLLVQRDGPNQAFSQPYWRMVESTPEVFIAHVKLSRLLNSPDASPDPGSAGRRPSRDP